MARRSAGVVARFGYDDRKVVGSPSDVRRILRPDKRYPDISIGRIHDLECDEILELGIDFGKRSNPTRPVCGWFEFHEDDVDEAFLTIEDDNEPPRHANIVKWPVDPSKRNLAIETLFHAFTHRAHFKPPVNDISEVESPCDYVEEIDYSENVAKPK